MREILEICTGIVLLGFAIASCVFLTGLAVKLVGMI